MIVLLFKTMLQHISLRVVKYIPWTQGMCNEVIHTEPRSLAFIPDHFKTQSMCDEAVEADPYMLKFVPVERALEKYLYPMRDVPNHLKTREMCNKAVVEDPWQLSDFPDHLKTQGMCEKNG